MNKYMRTYIDEDGNKVFHYTFPSIVALVNYLKEAPVNHETFPTLYSEMPDEKNRPFRGESLEATMEHLIYGYNTTYGEYREKSNVDSIVIDRGIDYGKVRAVRGYTGSRVDVQAFANGLNKHMLRPVRSVPKNFIKFNYDLTYRASVDEAKLRNHGLIAMYLIRALEENNFTVDLNCYNLIGQKIDPRDRNSKREIIYATFHIKEPEAPLNESMCIGLFERREFYRRIIFRLMETTPVCKAWQIAYGDNYFSQRERERFVKSSIDDIFYTDPEEMNIKGVDINEDFQSVINHLGLENVVTLRKSLK